MQTCQGPASRRLPYAWILSLGLALLALLALQPAGAFAQSTRTEQLEQQRAERARGQPAQSLSLLEKMLFLAEDRFLRPRPVPPTGAFYPRVGGVVVESGLGFGGGYRRSFANDTARVDAQALFTIRRYWLARAEVSLPRLFDRRLEIKALAQARHLPEEDYFGLGPGSAASDRTNYQLDEREYAAQVHWRPRQWLLIGSQHALLQPRVGSGGDSDHPSIENRFTESTAPGLTRATTFVEHGSLVSVDYRDSAGHPRRGGRYVFYVSRYDEARNRGFDFSRVAAHVEQYLPVFDRKRVIAVRLTADHLAAAAGSRVPFFYMPRFGGMDSHHGSDHLRFRDTNTWLFTAEYRWEVASGVDLAFMYDTGAVAPRFRDLSLGAADAAYGVGVRAGTDSAIFFRAEAIFGGREGARWFVGFSGPLKLERFLR